MNCHFSSGDQQRRDVRGGGDDNLVLVRRRRQGLGQAEKVPKEPQEPGKCEHLTSGHCVYGNPGFELSGHCRKSTSRTAASRPTTRGGTGCGWPTRGRAATPAGAGGTGEMITLRLFIEEYKGPFTFDVCKILWSFTPSSLVCIWPRSAATLSAPYVQTSFVKPPKTNHNSNRSHKRRHAYGQLW